MEEGRRGHSWEEEGGGAVKEEEVSQVASEEDEGLLVDYGCEGREDRSKEEENDGTTCLADPLLSPRTTTTGLYWSKRG